jgi:hypothetical protein
MSLGDGLARIVGSLARAKRLLDRSAHDPFIDRRLGRGRGEHGDSRNDL